MNIPVDQRMRRTLTTIAERERQKRIDKRAEYYENLSNKSRDPILKHLYIKCATLILQGKPDEVSKLLKRAREIITFEKRNNYNLRSSNLKHQELYKVKNLKDFVVDYAQKVKHKKELLYEFLKRMYALNKKYMIDKKKFAKIKKGKEQWA